MKSKKNILKIIMLLIIICILLVIFIIFNYKRIKAKNEYNRNEDESNIQINYQYDKVDNSTLFYTVSDCIQTYIDYISLNIDTDNYNDKQLELNIFTEQEKKEAIYNILDKEYIEENNITLDNIYSFIPNFDDKTKFTAIKMNMLDGNRIQRFCIYGSIENNEGDLEYIYCIVNLDYYNMTFSIKPILNETYDDINKIELEEETEEIYENNNNTFIYNRISEEDLISKYIYYYKTNAVLNSDIAYNLLDKEYREKRFGNIEEYKTYVENNKEKIYSSLLDSYQIKEDGDNTRYICIDQYGNYYIFTENAVMDYTVILDTYTIDLPEFTERYETATEQQKVALNIDKFMQAINNKDYKYAYNCLADSYKNNYFKTQADFENYAKENFYASSTVGYSEFAEEGDVYTYSVVLTDNETEEQMNKTFIMQLGEGTDFVLSFNR